MPNKARKRHKVILFDSVRKEGIFTERLIGLELDNPELKETLSREIRSAFKELFQEKRFRRGAYSTDFHLNLEPSGDTYIHRTSLYFVPERTAPIESDLERIISEISQRIRDVEARYKASRSDVVDSNIVLTKFVFNFKREMTRFKEKGRKRRIARKQQRLRRTLPMRRYWQVLHSLMNSGLSIKKARKIYRKASTKERTILRRNREVRKIKSVVRNIKRRKRRR